MLIWGGVIKHVLPEQGRESQRLSYDYFVQAGAESISQPVFARYLNVSKGLVSDWERGVKRPSGPALRLLTVVRNKCLQAIA